MKVKLKYAGIRTYVTNVVIERWKQLFREHLNGVENVDTGDHGNG